MAKSKKKKAALLTRQQIIKKYGITKKLIQDYFPKPEIIHARGRGGSWWTMEGWPEEVAAEAVLHPEIRKVLKAREEREMRERQIGEIMELYASFSPESYLEKARRLQRMFVLHVGPTNSGKTYNAIEDLKTHTPGTYLGPLRLLALEMFDKLNEAGIPCSMLTGEESIPVEGAVAVSSTIELCDFNTRYSTAVIDEAQLIADRNRGSAWLKAICLVDAKMVHICMAPEALPFIEGLIRSFGDPYNVVWHKRLAPLRYAGRCKGYGDFRPDDATAPCRRRPGATRYGSTSPVKTTLSLRRTRSASAFRCPSSASFSPRRRNLTGRNFGSSPRRRSSRSAAGPGAMASTSTGRCWPSGIRS